MQMKQPRFDSVNARFSVANAFLESLRDKNVCVKRQFFVSGRAAHSSRRVEEYG
jgi:hypothetical protein